MLQRIRKSRLDSVVMSCIQRGKKSFHVWVWLCLKIHGARIIMQRKQSNSISWLTIFSQIKLQQKLWVEIALNWHVWADVSEADVCLLCYYVLAKKSSYLDSIVRDKKQTYKARQKPNSTFDFIVSPGLISE